jgi:hypothetical protein
MLSMAAEWYFAKEDKKLGPVSNKGLRELALSGRITPETLLWREGLAEWIPASRVENLFAPASQDLPVHAESAPSPGSPGGAGAPPVVEWQPVADEGLPGVPSSPSRPRRDQSTERICWWLWLYAKVNFGLSLVIAAPLVGFGLFLILAGIVGAMNSVVTEKENRMVIGGVVLATGMVTGFLDIAAGLIVFFSLNAVTLAAAWGAKMLELTKQRTDVLRS